MCGRYAATSNMADLVAEFEVDLTGDDLLAPDYNVAPTKPVPAIVARSIVDTDTGEQSVRRELRLMRWGLVPSWAKDPSIGSRLINARRETVVQKPAFRKAFARRRCLLPAAGYYEWWEPENGPAGKGGKPLKQPYFIHSADGGNLAMAGLFEFWRDPTRADDDPARWLSTVTVITTEAEDELGRIHDRMPLLVAPDSWAAWLDPAAASGDDLAALQSMLMVAPPGALTAYPVGLAVNDVRHNGPDLLTPLPPEQVLGGVQAMF